MHSSQAILTGGGRGESSKSRLNLAAGYEVCGRSAAIARQEARWVETTAYCSGMAGARAPDPGTDSWMCQPDRRTLRPNSREHHHAGHSVFVAVWRAVHANAGRIWGHRFDDRRQQWSWLDVDLAANVRSARWYASGSRRCLPSTRDQWRGGIAAGAERQGVHPDLRRPGDGHCHRNLAGPASDQQIRTQ